jgi:hypothetical protein
MFCFVVSLFAMCLMMSDVLFPGIVTGIAKSYSEEPQSQDVPQGGVARFHCHIKSVPPPIYMWQKDDRKQIRPGPR